MSPGPFRTRPLILLTGATGYVGGRLLRALEERGERVRCLARRPEALPTASRAEVVAGDVLDVDPVAAALRRRRHGLLPRPLDGRRAPISRSGPRAPRQLRARPREAGVARIVYLGGLGDGRGPLQPSREPPGGRARSCLDRRRRRSSSGPRSCSARAASRSR